MAADPWAAFNPQAAAPVGALPSPPEDPLKAHDAARQDASTASSITNNTHDNVVADKKLRVDNPQALRKEYDALPEVKNYQVATQQLSQALGTGEGPQADLALTYAFAKAMDPDSVVRESEQASVGSSQAWLDSAAENVKKQFGMDGAGTYTPAARAALRQQIIRAVASRNKIYGERRSQFEELARRNNIDPFEVVGPHIGGAYIDQARDYDQQRREDGAVVAPVGGFPDAPPPANPAATPPLSGGGPNLQPATGNSRQVPDPETAAQVDAMLKKGASFGDINSFAQSRGMAPMKPQEYVAVRAFIKKNPGYQGSLADATKYEPQTGFEKTVTGAVGNDPSGIGGYVMGAGQMLTGNTLDNMTGDPERARMALDIVNTQSPNASAAGGITGGIMAGALGEAGLARLGMGAGMARGAISDIAMGGANGAGAADTGSRLSGLAKGAGYAAAGGILGAGATKGVGRALNPTGGALTDLYSAGVRPTPGQRFANSGFTGAALNKTEEALQSLPIVGSAIKGARQKARDDFQTGAFNQALAEIGEKLPADKQIGTAAHAHTQEVFNRIYTRARSGMKVVGDAELKNDLGNLAGDIATLGPAAQNKLKAIWSNSVNSKFTGGQMTGNAYKGAVSDLKKRAAQFRKGSTADDQALADVLDGVQGALDAAARRHSPKEAVALLDAADAGYAKLVRIEEAAAKRGGDDGTFSPAQFSGAVQKTSGGVRSKAFLRGDALMQDYAAAGRSLEDKLPNSGTADRALTAMGLATSAMFSPVGAAYAPGVRKLTTGALAPSTNAAAKAISAQLQKRARLVGAAGASTAVALPGTSPGQ